MEQNSAEPDLQIFRAQSSRCRGRGYRVAADADKTYGKGERDGGIAAGKEGAVLLIDLAEAAETIAD